MPSDDDEPKNAPRRDFLGIALGGTAAAFAVAVVYPLGRFMEPPARPASGPTNVGKVEDFAPGSSKTVLIGDHPVLVIHTADGEFRAFSALCTHLQCVVGYSPDQNRIVCPCHGGVYSVDGQNLSGPPPRPLDEYPVSINDGAVIVSFTG
jgi:cytochrome b6-f complex iron-sulfur subunit